MYAIYHIIGSNWQLAGNYTLMDEVRPPRREHELRDALWVQIDGSYEDFYSSIAIELTGEGCILG